MPVVIGFICGIGIGIFWNVMVFSMSCVGGYSPMAENNTPVWVVYPISCEETVILMIEEWEQICAEDPDLFI
jgi:hypothetical protein